MSIVDVVRTVVGEVVLTKGGVHGSGRGGSLAVRIRQYSLIHGFVRNVWTSGMTSLCPVVALKISE